MAKAKAKATSGSIELGPDLDPTILYNNYVKECKDIGLEPYGPMKDVLTNEENPNIGKQLIILPSTENERFCFAIFYKIVVGQYNISEFQTKFIQRLMLTYKVMLK